MQMVFITEHINLPLQSQAHLQVAQADTRPKPAKELAYSNTRTEKYAAKMKDRITNDKNGQLVTRYIKIGQIQLKSRVVARFKLCIGLTVMCSEVPNFSYTETVTCYVRKTTVHNNNDTF